MPRILGVQDDRLVWRTETAAPRHRPTVCKNVEACVIPHSSVSSRAAKAYGSVSTNKPVIPSRKGLWGTPKQKFEGSCGVAAFKV